MLFIKMTSLPSCLQCGGTDFFVESGFYFCSECQFQSQDIREEALEKEFCFYTTQTKTVKPSSQAGGNDEETIKGSELTSWEVLNYILKGWVDELLSLEVDSKVKLVALQLWVAYLQRLEVAFTSTIIQKKPRLGVTHKLRDAELVYGVTQSQAKLLKNPFGKSRDSASSRASSKTSGSSISRVRSKQRKVLAQALYEEESVLSDRSYANITLDNLSTSSISSTKSSKMCYTEYAKKTISKLFGDMEDEPEVELREFNYLHALTYEKKSLRHMSTLTIFAILRLALLICKSPVQLSDLLRWSREGYLSLKNSARLLPRSVHITKDNKVLLVNPINSSVNVTKKVYYLSQCLGIQNLSVDFASICKRLIEELHLPNDMNIIVNRLLNISMPTFPLSARVNYEGRAVAFIIFILKLSFSLDGITELSNSEAATKINNRIDSAGNDEKHLFVWTDWVESLEFQDAVFSNYHLPSRELWYPGADLSNTSEVFLGQWSMAPKMQILRRKCEVNASIASTLDRILTPLSTKGVAPPKPSMTPSISIIKDISPELLPDVRNKLTDLLEAPGQSSISIYFNTTRLSSLAEKYNCQVCHGVSTNFRFIKKYAKDKIKPRSQYLKKLITVTLTGGINSYDYYNEDDNFFNLFEQILDSDNPDDPTWKYTKKNYKRRRLNEKRVRNDDSTSNDSFSSELNSEQNEMSSNKHYSNMKINLNNVGNIALRHNLNEQFINFENLQSNINPVLYIPGDSYWRLEGSFDKDSIGVEDFEEFARSSFSPSFLWLLKRCSTLIDQSMREVYEQLIIVENVYLKFAARSQTLPKNYKNKW